MTRVAAHVDPTPPTDGPLAVRSVTRLVGNTPVVEIRRVRDGIAPGVRILAKLEGFNPGGSVKDRPVVKMVEDGVARGALVPGKTILDSTSGNTGIALAMVGAALGHPVKLVMPSNVSQERKRVVAAFGAEVVYSDPLEGSDGAIRLCRKILAEDPERYFKPDQYNNPANSLAHYEGTGPEIWRQTDGKVSHFVAGIGTGGTIMGTGRYLKERNPAVQVVAAEPEDAFHGLEGLKHMASSIVPGIFHEEQLDLKLGIGTEDAYNMVYRLGREEGLLVGQSSGAAHVAALAVARGLCEGTVVVLFPDFGDRYLSTNLWLGWQPPAGSAVKRVSSPTPRRGGAKRREKFYLTYPTRLVREPLIYWVGRKFDVVTNIRSASVSEEIGIIALELDGTREAIDGAVAWFREQGVTVEPIEKNVIE